MKSCRPRKPSPWRRFELHYTPKNGSWLIMAEIEFAGAVH